MLHVTSLLWKLRLDLRVGRRVADGIRTLREPGDLRLDPREPVARRQLRPRLAAYVRPEFARNVLLASRAYMVRGQAYLDAGMARLAINDFDEALRLNPDDHEALGRRGSLYGELGEYKLALADLKRAADLRPSMAIHYSALCLVNIRRAAWAEAIADCDRALAISPGDARAREYRQSIDASMTKLRAVLAELRGHLKSHPADARAYLQQGLLLQSLEGRGSALGSFRRACDLGDANGCFRLLAVD